MKNKIIVYFLIFISASCVLLFCTIQSIELKIKTTLCKYQINCELFEHGKITQWYGFPLGTCNGVTKVAKYNIDNAKLKAYKAFLKKENLEPIIFSIQRMEKSLSSGNMPQYEKQLVQYVSLINNSNKKQKIIDFLK